MNSSLKRDLSEVTDELINDLNNAITEDDPKSVLKDIEKDLSAHTNGIVKSNSKLYKAITLNEFQNGVLMTSVIPSQYRTFAIDMCRKLQEEFRCEFISEKSLCELVTVSYIRTLEIQRRINNLFTEGLSGDIEVRFLAILSKELDRANRHYITAIQNLKMSKQPPMKVVITTDKAIIGQNQLFQGNSHE
jgi:hypothetical protein